MMKKKQDITSEFAQAVIQVNTAFRQFIQQKFRQSKLDLTFEMFQVMVCLWQKDGVNQQEIAKAVQKNKASVTPLIDNLVKIDLVTRSEDTVDRRNKIISLTNKGKDYKKKFAPMISEIYASIKGDISDEKLKEITGLLLTVSRNMK